MSKLKQITISVFDHNHTFVGYAGGTPYLYYKTNDPFVDGSGRGHLRLYATCDICGKEILVAYTHVNGDGTLYEPKKK
jgi:hypothetical protein